MMMWRDKKSLGVEFVQATVSGPRRGHSLVQLPFFLSPHILVSAEIIILIDEDTGKILFDNGAPMPKK